MHQQKYTKTAQTNLKKASHAVAFLANKLAQENMAGVIFFCSSEYDLDQITLNIKQYFSCPIIGCTTAGEINEKYQTGGISGVSFSSDAFVLHSHLIKLSDDFEVVNGTKLQNTYYSPSIFTELTVGQSSVGFLLIDGLSLAEEKITSDISKTLPMLPFIGGSAGDGLNFSQTQVFYQGMFHNNAAIFTFIETKLDFKTFQLQHFQATETEIVVTEADPENRIVTEIDGEPAAAFFAETLGLPENELTIDVFSMNPLMIKIGEDWHVRSIQKANPDGSLQFYCAIENGLPLTIGKGVGITKTLKEKIDGISTEFSEIELTLGCDCILRQLEIFKKNKTKDIESLLSTINFVGFNTYGEQFNSIHVNQTLTGIVFGEIGHKIDE